MLDVLFSSVGRFKVHYKLLPLFFFIVMFNLDIKLLFYNIRFNYYFARSISPILSI